MNRVPKSDDYVRWTTPPDAAGFVQTIDARVMFAHKGQPLFVRAFAVYAFHPEHVAAQGGRWLPPPREWLAVDPAAVTIINDDGDA